ncbi:MAG: hypothetical protein ABSH47_15815 [Bryobacteraceae bacterium]|jgi:hypothetical protein
MDMADIQRAIETLPVEQQTALLDWLAGRDRLQWDREIERDFSPGGLGMNLFDHVKAQAQRGESVQEVSTRDAIESRT